MFFRHSNLILRYSCCRVLPKYRTFSTQVLQPGGEKDVTGLFFNEEVQQHLKLLTRVDLKKIYRRRLDGRAREAPQYKFMTTQQLEDELAKVKAKAEVYLQMPPVVKQYTDSNIIVSKDPALQGLDTASYVFTDITFGTKDRDRLILVREPNGNLRYAKRAEKHRLNQVYFPFPGREHGIPKMFSGEPLKDLLNRHEYEFILDRACCQFEPDDPDFHRVRKEVYDHVNEHRKYNILRSTRHFGPMAFILVVDKEMDNLLLDIIQTGNIDEAVSLVQLFHKVHPDAESAKTPFDGDKVEFIKNYASHDSPSKVRITKALDTYKEIQEVKQETAEAIQKSHGLHSPTENV